MRPRIRDLVTFAVAACAVLLAGTPAIWGQVIDPELESVLDGLRPQDQVRVIVRFTDQVDLDQFQHQDTAVRRALLVSALKARAAASQAAVQHVLDTPAASRVASLWGVNGLALTASAQVITALAHNPNVARIGVDAVIEAPGPLAGEAAAAEWNLAAIRAPELWAAGHTGSGIVVGSMDTGVDAAHPDLAASYRGGSNSWFDPYGQHSTPSDRNGHGTQTVGLMVGGSAGGTAIGVAPGAQWIAARIFDDAGSGTLGAIHQAFQWMLDPDGNPGTDDGADVVNGSWSLANIGGCSLEFEQDLQVLAAAQVAAVFAGGNYGPYPGTSVSPANNPSGFAVGSIDDLSQVSSFSSSGPSACDGSVYPEVVAPGYDVRTADLDFGYAWVTGTSFAAPHVSGGMALLLSAHPSATVSQLEQSLEDTAADLGATGPDNAYGYGRIDLVEASAWLASPPGPSCNDLDGDLFFAEEGCGTSLDCNDLDAGINPAACDIKNDGIDQDCDGVDRTRGKSCPGGGETDPPTDPPPTAEPEGKGGTCSDGVDNDLDGLTDCADPDCSKNRSCR